MTSGFTPATISCLPRKVHCGSQKGNHHAGWQLYHSSKETLYAGGRLAAVLCFQRAFFVASTRSKVISDLYRLFRQQFLVDMGLERNIDHFVRINEHQENSPGTHQGLHLPSATNIRWKAWRFIRRFFPWTTEIDQRDADFSKRQTFPWIGVAALLCAASTCVFSFIILIKIDGKKEITSKALKPASWLSAILSLNSIALHIALSEGVTTAWWYTASRRDVTYRQLHDTWKLGTSLGAVLLSGDKFNYVAMATIFVATVPLNGLLLQNAIHMVPSSYTNDTVIKVNMAKTWPVGFSAQYDNITDTIGSYNDAFGYANWLTFSPYSQRYFYVPVNQVSEDDVWGTFYDTGCYNHDNMAICQGNATSVGFQSTCHTTKIPYNLEPSTSKSNLTARVFESSIIWTAAQPNTINITVLWKPEASCRGHYERKTCILKAANVTYPVQIYSSAYEGSGSVLKSGMGSMPYIALDDYNIANTGTLHDLLPVAAGESDGSTTFGGFAHALASRYNSSLDWSYSGATASWTVTTKGAFAGELAPAVGFISAGSNAGTTFNPSPTSDNFCEINYLGLTVDDAGDDSDILAQIRGDVRQLAFMSSVMQFYKEVVDYLIHDGKGDYFLENAQPIYATQTQTLLRYNIKWVFWIASLVVTLTICSMIAPTFYGFWKLNRVATLSPFDTAAAFKAPGIHDHQGFESKPTKILLKEIGKTHLHSHSAEWSQQEVYGMPHPQHGMVTVTAMELPRPEQVRGGEEARGRYHGPAVVAGPHNEQWNDGDQPHAR